MCARSPVSTARSSAVAAGAGAADDSDEADFCRAASAVIPPNRAPPCSAKFRGFGAAGVAARCVCAAVALSAVSPKAAGGGALPAYRRGFWGRDISLNLRICRRWPGGGLDFPFKLPARSRGGRRCGVSRWPRRQVGRCLGCVQRRRLTRDRQGSVGRNGLVGWQEQGRDQKSREPCGRQRTYQRGPPVRLVSRRTPEISAKRVLLSRPLRGELGRVGKDVPARRLGGLARVLRRCAPVFVIDIVHACSLSSSRSFVRA